MPAFNRRRNIRGMESRRFRRGRTGWLGITAYYWQGVSGYFRKRQNVKKRLFSASAAYPGYAQTSVLNRNSGSNVRTIRVFHFYPTDYYFLKKRPSFVIRRILNNNLICKTRRFHAPTA
jgi:hypothetical protein